MSFWGWKLSKSECERLRGRREASLSSIMAWLWRAGETWWDERRHSPLALRKRSRGSSLMRRQNEPACPSVVDVKISVCTHVPAYVFGTPRPQPDWEDKDSQNVKTLPVQGAGLLSLTCWHQHVDENLFYVLWRVTLSFSFSFGFLPNTKTSQPFVHPFISTSFVFKVEHGGDH